MALNFEPKVNKKMSRPDRLMFSKGRFLDYTYVLELIFQFPCKSKCFPKGVFTIYVYSARWVGGPKSGKTVNVVS